MPTEKNTHQEDCIEAIKRGDWKQAAVFIENEILRDDLAYKKSLIEHLQTYGRILSNEKQRLRETIDDLIEAAELAAKGDNMTASKYTYRQYLETWEGRFGGANCGEFEYWHYGREMTKTLPMMTEAQFKETLAQFDTLSSQIDELQKRPDYTTNDKIGEEVDRLMAETFKCELLLFF